MGWRRLAESGIHAGLVIASGAMAMTQLALALHGRHGQYWNYTGMIGAATGALYCFHRLVSSGRWSGPSLPPRMASLKRDHAILQGSVLAWTALAVFLAERALTPRLFLWMLPAILMSIAYVIPVTRSGKRLRDMGWTKILWIGLAWTWLTAFIPTHVLAGLPMLNSAVQGLERIAFIVAITIPFDIRDRSDDALQGLRTVAHRLHDRLLLRLGTGLFLLSILAAAFNGLHFLNVAYALVPLILLLPFRLLLLRSLRTSDDLFYSGLVDGLMVLAWLLFLLLEYLL